MQWATEDRHSICCVVVCSSECSELLRIHTVPGYPTHAMLDLVVSVGDYIAVLVSGVGSATAT